MDEDLKFKLKELAARERTTLQKIIVAACEDLLVKKKSIKPVENVNVNNRQVQQGQSTIEPPQPGQW